ncbi:2-hydroxycyclohexanecarboxyl-CoA dehydrogenase [Rhodococcus wratislaviensis]|uniref:2-hydroxycyclohexanecarboxyl-CoA dehydrogenase n=1 Tax=Rhodococcus wratislaviensis TaxID=44752 RepID=A0A402CEX0_RHOWR|nr:2-hydroxycyclohexanecarboxyl-CoA dehydrogenase [Rhodococcus wratislaviensis]
MGHAAAKMLLDRGARVGLHYRSNAEPIKQLIAEYGQDRALPIQADLTDRAMLTSGVEQVVATYGQLDGCLNTVGTALRMKPFLDISDDVVDETIATELRGVITSAQAVLPHLIEAGGGHFVLVGSDSGKVGTSGEVISAACRGGIVSFAKSLAREYARQNVLVNVVCPGPTDTGLWEDLVENDEFGGKIGNAMIRAIPLRRIGKAEEVAAAAIFLLSGEASYITGQAISVSGGLTMS